MEIITFIFGLFGIASLQYGGLLNNYGIIAVSILYGSVVIARAIREKK